MTGDLGMDGRDARICARHDLSDGGRATRFAVEFDGRTHAAFVIAFDGVVHAYFNHCPHRGTELDWQPGEVFDEFGQYLVCATHGAAFAANTGLCVSGPCVGSVLKKIQTSIVEDAIFLPSREGRLVRVM